MGICVKLMTTLDDNKELAYSLVWGQFSEIMRTEVEAHEKCMYISQEIDMLGIISFIKDNSYRYKYHKHMAHILYEVHSQFFTLYHYKYMTYQDYLE